MSEGIAFDAVLFDFDGVLVESEYAGNRQLAAWLTGAGHPIDVDEAMDRFMGYAGADFLARVEAFIGAPIPESFHDARRVEDERAMAEGVGEVSGAVAFVRSLPAALPKAIVSSSGKRWIRRHLEDIGLADAFGDRIFSGREDVANGKPAPDLYLYAAAALGVPIARCAIIEDSPVGVTGAVASGGYVIGLCAGRHCGVGHAERLRALGVSAVAGDFTDVARLLASPSPRP